MRIKKDGDEVNQADIKKKNVWIINTGAQYSTSKRAIKYAEKYKEGVYAVVGLHPMHACYWSKEIESFEELDIEKI